jgi:hypothetical protein
LSIAEPEAIPESQPRGASIPSQENPVQNHDDASDLGSSMPVKDGDPSLSTDQDILYPEHVC